MLATRNAKIAAAVVLLALVIVPAPLLPPLGLAGMVQSFFHVGWKAAYLVSAIGLQIALFGSLGTVAAFAVGPGKSGRQRWLQLLFVPLVVVGITVLVRSLKLGYVPMLANAVVQMAACAFGVTAGLLFRQKGWQVTLAATLVLALGLSWAYWPVASSELSSATIAKLQQLVASVGKIPAERRTFRGVVTDRLCAFAF